MRFKPLVLVTALVVASPAAASAATAYCVNVYYRCLNDTWDTSGIARILADVECGARYAGCIRASIR